MRRILLYFASLYCCTAALAQREFHLSAGFNLGAFGWSPATQQVMSGNNVFQRTASLGFGQIEDVNGNKRLSFLTNTSIGVHAGILLSDKKAMNFSGLRLEFQNNKACYDFINPFSFVSSAGDSVTRWVMSDKYLKYSLAFHQSIQISDYNNMMQGPRAIYFGVSYGQTFFHRNFNDRLKQNNFEDWSYKGTGFTSNTISVRQTSGMLSVEVGERLYSDDHLRWLDLGVSWYQPFQSTYTDEYEFFRDSIATGKTRLTYGKGTLNFTLRYSFDHLVEKRQRDTTKKVHPVKRDDIAKHELNGRKLDVQEEISVRSDTITVWVWDRGRSDGDRISLYLNDKLVLEDFELQKEKKSITLHLEPGDNYLVMHAVNLGTLPPNTCAMGINDGSGKKKDVTVVSDLGKSGTIRISNKKLVHKD